MCEREEIERKRDHERENVFVCVFVCVTWLHSAALNVSAAVVEVLLCAAQRVRERSTERVRQRVCVRERGSERVGERERENVRCTVLRVMCR